MIDNYHKAAKVNQIRIVNSCGFDSVPSDLGVYYIHKIISKKISNKNESNRCKRNLQWWNIC